jgi:hypothetical protein
MAVSGQSRIKKFLRLPFQQKKAEYGGVPVIPVMVRSVKHKQ